MFNGLSTLFYTVNNFSKLQVAAMMQFVENISILFIKLMRYLILKLQFLRARSLFSGFRLRFGYA